MARTQPPALCLQRQEGPESIEQGRELMGREPWLPPCQSPWHPALPLPLPWPEGSAAWSCQQFFFLLRGGTAHQPLLSPSTGTAGFGVCLFVFFHMQLPLLCISWEKIGYNMIFLIFLLCL